MVNPITNTPLTKTEYVTFEGIAYWAKLSRPDEFRGAERWTMNLYLSPEDIERYKKLGIQKKLNTNDIGTYFSPQRPTTKMIAGKLVYFTPPVIYDKDGKVLVGYYNEEGNLVRSYEDKKKKITKKGEDILIGNGSTVLITLSVYPTAMGVGNRLESVRLVDLITYRPDEPSEVDEPNNPGEVGEGEESVEDSRTETEKALNDKIEW